MFARNYRAPIPELTLRIYPTFPTSTMALNPPPLKLYDCASLALDDIHEFVKGQGYTMSTFRSKTDKQSPPTVRKMWLRCAKGKSYKMTARKRLTGSRMTGCPFELTLTRTAIGWQVEVQEPTHNHEAFAYAAAHRRQVEVVAAKLVRVLPYRSLRNQIN